MTCACQMIATDSRPIRNTQIARARFVCVSAAGRRRVRTNQVMKDLLVPIVLRRMPNAAKRRRGRRDWSNLSSIAQRDRNCGFALHSEDSALISKKYASTHVNSACKIAEFCSPTFLFVDGSRQFVLSDGAKCSPTGTTEKVSLERYFRERIAANTSSQTSGEWR